jgi:ADP-ribose pyrophosphatase
MGKIPAHAKKVFTGKIFDVYQWKQTMFDGSTEIFECLKRPNTIEVIATQGEKILMSRQSQPNKHNYLSLFGGRAEKDEPALATAKRELLEESGLESHDWELFKVYEPVHKIDWQVFTYIARNCKQIAEPQLDSGEQIETITCTFEEFIDLVQDDAYWGTEFTLDILKMKQAGTLEEFRKQLFG